MPQNLNNIHHEQWGMCDQCGFFYPMSQLVKQKGQMHCTTRHCFDNLQIERRTFMIEQVMGPGQSVDAEGSDRRVIDRGFFEGFDETNR